MAIDVRYGGFTGIIFVTYLYSASLKVHLQIYQNTFNEAIVKLIALDMYFKIIKATLEKRSGAVQKACAFEK